MPDIHKLKAALKTGVKVVKDLELEGEALSNSAYDGIEFRNCWLSDADFSNSSLKGCKFISCNLKCANFTNADLSGASIVDCNIESILCEVAPRIDNLNFSNNSCFGVTLSQEESLSVFSSE